MTESVSENSNFTTQDLFSPLQFCEVVEEQQQQRRQLQQQLQHNNSQQHSVLNTSQQHNGSIQNSGPLTAVKQENAQQQIAVRIVEPVNEKQPLISMSACTISAVEYQLNPNQPQSIESPIGLVNFQQHQQSQITQQIPVYQVQLNRPPQQMQSMQVNSIQVSPPSTNGNASQINGSSVTNTSMSNFPMSVNDISSGKTNLVTTTAVATQITALAYATGKNENDNEPEIVYTSVGIQNHSKTNDGDKKSPDNTNEEEKKPVPVKRTWRRPWKKKKEREKRPPVKRARKVKRRRMVVSKKSAIHVDPRHGPPIDTSNTLVTRDSKETINQMKQKRQRIKMNRNSGREYVNRLGKVVRARKIGSPCNCPLKCWDRMGSKILDIFNNFWDLCDFNLQNSYLFTCLKLCDVKRRYTKKPAEESRRQNTFEYFVRISGKHLRCCKKAFMSSHGLTSDKRLRTLFTQMKDGALIPEPDRRGKHLRPSKSQVTPPPPHYLNKMGGSKKTTKNQTKKRPQPTSRFEVAKQAMYTPPNHPHNLHHHCTPPPLPTMQEPPHAYIPNGDIYFPSHYLEPPQSMAPHHMNQVPPSCQKMLETPAYFMAGMKENTFHQ